MAFRPPAPQAGVSTIPPRGHAFRSRLDSNQRTRPRTETLPLGDSSEKGAHLGFHSSPMNATETNRTGMQICRSAHKYGAKSGNRTHDTLIFSQLLYQLSYLDILAHPLGIGPSPPHFQRGASTGLA